MAAYIERNPVTAGLAARPEDYGWSSAAMGEAGHRQDCRCGRPGGPLHDEGFQATAMQKQEGRGRPPYGGLS